MNNNLVDSIIGNNLAPFEITRKKEYLHDLINLQMSSTSRMDALFSTEFHRESIQLIINAMELFEKGYFDCAFYSLRQSIEITSTIVFFVDDEDESNRKKNLQKWQKEEWFPLQNQMLKELDRRNSAFKDISNNMPNFLKQLELTKKRLNKYVHKQGFDKYYVSRNNPFRKNNFDKEKLASDFEEMLKMAISTIAIFRLAVDPLPILLIDDIIANRIPDIITEPYTDEFVLKYIGTHNFEDFKRTELYITVKNDILKREERKPAIVNILRDSYIDRSQIKEIAAQIHLLSINDKAAVLFTLLSNKIATIRCTGGWSHYFTDISTVRERKSWGTDELKYFDNGKSNQFNLKYDEAYLSCILVSTEKYYLEHNEPFTDSEIQMLKENADAFNKKKE